MVDIDNDGWPDIFYVTGNVYPELERVFPRFPSRSQPILFRNLGNGHFAEMGEEAGPQWQRVIAAVAALLAILTTTATSTCWS